MALLTIKCPACAAEGRMSLVDPIYEGPYKCWKCHALFSIRIEGGQLKSCHPLSKEEQQRQQEERRRQQEIEELKSKFKKGSSDRD